MLINLDERFLFNAMPDTHVQSAVYPLSLSFIFPISALSVLLLLFLCLSVSVSVSCLLSMFPFSASHSPSLSPSSLPHPSIFYPPLLKPWTHRSCTNSTAVAVPLHCNFKNFIRKPNSELPNDPRRRLSQFNMTSKQHLRGNFIGLQWSGYCKAISAGPV